MTESPHQLVYNLYNIIALTEIKGYAMLQFSYMMLKIYGKVEIVMNRAEKLNILFIRVISLWSLMLPKKSLNCKPQRK